MRFALLGLALLVSWPRAMLASKPPWAQINLVVLRPDCAQTNAGEINAAIAGAARLLRKACGLRLQVTQSTRLGEQACALSSDLEVRTQVLRQTLAPFRKADPRTLALLTLPSSPDETRLSYAWVDRSLRAACDSPQEARFLNRFGGIFVTDIGWDIARQMGEDGATLLLTHEILHALTQRAHPTRATRGQVLADALTDMGPAISPETCACAKRSPYVRIVRAR